MKLCDPYLRRHESHYAAVLDMIGGRKGRRTIVSCDRKDENLNGPLLFFCFVVLNLYDTEVTFQFFCHGSPFSR